MIVAARVTIAGSKAAVWAAITDLEHESYETRAESHGFVLRKAILQDLNDIRSAVGAEVT